MHRGAILALSMVACGGETPLDGAHLHAHPDAIDLGFADCGGATPAADWVVENDGAAPLEVTATPDPRLTLDQTHFFVDAHSSLSVHVAGLPASKDGHAGDVAHASIHVSTNDAVSRTFDIDVSATTHGAALALVPPQIDLGLIPVSMSSPPHGFALVNAGNADVDVSLSQANPDFTIALDTLHLIENQTVQGTATFFASSPGATKTTVSVDEKGTICGAVPKLDVLATATEGVFGVSPAYLDFGEVPCAHATKSQTLTLINGGDSPYSFTASFASGAGFQVTPPSGVVKKTLTLTVTPAPIPKYSATTYDLYGDTLTIKTNIPEDAPHDVLIHETAFGAILHFAQPAVSFGKAQVGVDAIAYASVSNDGNVSPSCIDATDGNFDFHCNGASVTFHPHETMLGQTETATFTLQAAGPTCGPSPTLTVDATSHDVAGGVLALDDATCVTTNNQLTTERVYCWGSNASGQLGTSTVTSSLTPRYVDLSPWQVDGMEIGGGGSHVAVDWNWGLIDWGAVNGVASGITVHSSSVGSASASSDVACFDFGGVACFGKGGDLGDGTTNASTSPVFVTSTNRYFDVGYDGHVCAQGWSYADSYWVNYCWGPDDWGQLGDGTYGANQRALSPVQAQGIDWSYENLAAGDGFTCAYSYVLEQTVCFGRNTSGESGAPPSSSPVLTANVVSLAPANSIDAGRDFTCLELSTHDVECWGSNVRGQLGDGIGEQLSSTPVHVALANTVTPIWYGRPLSTGNQHACAVLSDSRLQCWGSNTHGELGDGTTNDAPSPVFVKGFD